MVSIRPARLSATRGRVKHIGRAGEQKPARTIVLIDGLLDGQEQVRCALDLVDDRFVQTPDESGRIGLGSREDRLIVERDVGPVAVPHLFDERGLAGPARSHDQDHRGIRKGFLGPPLYKSLKHVFPESRTIGTIGLG